MRNKINIKNILTREVFYMVPLFFLLFSFGSDFQKFLILTLLLPLFIFVLIFLKKYVHIKSFYLYTYEKIIGLFLLLSFFSTILSNNKYSSFFGDFNNHVFSFIVIFISTIFFLYLARFKDLFNDKNKVLKFFLYSSIVLFIYKISSSFFPILDVFKFGTEELIIIASLNVLLFTPLLLSGYFPKNLTRILKYFLFILFFLISMVFYKPFFIVFALAFFLQILMIERNLFSSILKKKYVFLIFLIFFFGLLLSVGQNNTYKIKVNNLDRNTSLDVMMSAIKTDFLFGSGLGSYSDIFSLNRPADFNYENNWQLRFKNSYSFVCNISVTAGALAASSFIFFIVFVFHIIFESLKSYNKNKKDYLFISIIGSGIFVLTLPFLTTFSYLSFLLFWFFLAILVNYLSNNSFYKNKGLLLENKSGVFQIIFYLFIIFWILLLAFNVKYLIADFHSRNITEESIIKAINFNPNLEEYHITLSKIYLEKAKSELKKANKDYGYIAINIDEAKKWAEKAISINPYSVVPYETLGIIYRDIANYSSNGEVFAIAPLEKAFSLEPSNPVLATEIGKLYLLQKNNDESLKYFNKAYSLKNDYVDASLGLAKVMIENNNNREAIELLDRIKAEDFNNSKIYFELGRAYFNMKNNSSAIENFQRALLFEPNNSNALYSLAVVYERMGDSESAYLYYKKTQDLNPGNIELMKKLQEIK